MYIKNIHIGAPDADTPRNCAYYDFDAAPLHRTASNIVSVTYRSAVINEEAIGDFAIDFSCNRIATDSSSVPEYQQQNQTIVRGIGFGDWDDPNSNLFPFLIQYTNSTTPILNRTNLEYTDIAIDAATDQPANWELERSQFYYFRRSHYTGDNTMYTYEQIPPDFYDWQTLRTYCVSQSINKIFYNNELAFKCYIGTAEKGLCFNVGKSDGSSLTPFTTPLNCIYQRSSFNYTSSSLSRPYYTVGGLRNTFEDLIGSSQFIMPSAQAAGLTMAQISQSNPFSAARTTNTTNPNPITECSMMQFGQVKYGGKVYTGIWHILYMPEYYWGYFRKGNSGSWSLSRLDLDNPAEYNPDLMRNRISEISFYGFRADALDLLIETEEGEVPAPPTPPSGDYPGFEHRLLSDRGYGLLADPNTAGFHVYCLDTANFSKLASTLWNWQNFGAILNQQMQQTDDQGSPITDFISSWISTVGTTLIDQKIDPSACIVFCRKMPKYVCDKSSGSWTVRIGGSNNFGIVGSIFSMERLTWQTVTSIELGSPTGTYLDLDPYVQTTLYLPYIGAVPIETDSYIGGSIQIGYASDVISGLTSVLVVCCNHKGQYKTYGPFVGDPSVQVPLAIQDSNSMGRAFGIAKAATSAVIAAAGGGELAMLSAGSGLTEAIMAKQHGQSLTSTGSNSAFVVPTEIMLQVTYPDVVDISDTMATIGVSSYRPGRVSDFFVAGDPTPIKYTYVDTSGLTCTDGEAHEIESLLQGGIIL